MSISTKLKKPFTIVVCTYNGERFLNKCLTALENLDELHDLTEKIYVVDNNSSDSTPEIAKKFCEQDDLFEYVFEKRQGLSYAREQAVKATTEWVIYVDDDNMLDKNWLIELKKTTESHKGVGVVNGAVIATPEQKLDNEQKAILQVMYRNLACTHCKEPTSEDEPNIIPMGAGMCVRTDALKEIEKEGWLKLKGREGKKLSSGEDTELCERVFAQGYSYVSNYKMKLYHIIPQARLEEQYVIRLIDGLVKGRVDFIRSQKLGYIKCKLRKIKYAIEKMYLKQKLITNKNGTEEYWKYKVKYWQADSYLRYV